MLFDKTKNVLVLAHVFPALTQTNFTKKKTINDNLT